ncbi:MAG TPA: hypothetical protein VFZ61_03730 [Polyangiales bacterium]
MKCDRRWWNDGRLEREAAAWGAWQNRRPEWGFTLTPGGNILGDYVRPMAEWEAEREVIERLYDAAAWQKPEPYTPERLNQLLHTYHLRQRMLGQKLVDWALTYKRPPWPMPVDSLPPRATLTDD